MTTHGATLTPQYLANYAAATNYYLTNNTPERLTGGPGVPREQYNHTQEQTYGEIDYTTGMQTPPTIVSPMNQHVGHHPTGTMPKILDPVWLQLILGAILAMVANIQHSNGNMIGNN